MNRVLVVVIKILITVTSPGEGGLCEDGQFLHLLSGMLSRTLPVGQEYRSVPKGSELTRVPRAPT